MTEQPPADMRALPDLAAERAEGRFDAVFAAVGAHLSKRVDIPAGDGGRIVDAGYVTALQAANSHVGPW